MIRKRFHRLSYCLLVLFPLLLNTLPSQTIESKPKYNTPLASSLSDQNLPIHTLAQKSTSPQAVHRADGTLDIGPLVRQAQLPIRLTEPTSRTRLPAHAQQQEQGPGYTVGMTRTFVVGEFLFPSRFSYVQTTYDVRLISDTVEIWVQSDLSYYYRDGRVNEIHPSARDAAYITADRITTLAKTFQDVILPTDVSFFGDYKSRDGQNAQFAQQLGLPADYYAGPGERVILLVSNIRDDSFYDPTKSNFVVGGVYIDQIDNLADRNIISIDSANWDRSMGAPNYNYEGTIAHEFQHLIHSNYVDNEETWFTEGSAVFAEFLVGYKPTAESHGDIFFDFPENSLFFWGDQDTDPDQPGLERRGDYDMAYLFLLYLAGRLKAANMHTTDNQYLKDVAGLVRNPAHAMTSVDMLLESLQAPFRIQDLYIDFRLAVLDARDSTQQPVWQYVTQYQPPSHIPIAPIDFSRLRRNLTFEGYDTLGVPFYGSDYIEIGWSPAIKPYTVLAFNGNVTLPNRVLLTFVTFDDKNGPGMHEVYHATLNTNGDGTFVLGNVLMDEGFNEPGERVIAVVSALPSPQDPYRFPKVAAYSLSGLPPSVYTSRARALGTAHDSGVYRPSVYPSDVFTMTVTVDNFGHGTDLTTSAPTPAFVAVPLPVDTTFVAGSFRSTVTPGNGHFVANLQTLSSQLPAQPGVYWNGTVVKTAELSFMLKTALPVPINTYLTPVAYITNAPFDASPSQFFTRLEAAVRVASPFDLSQLHQPISVASGASATFRYTLLNMDEVPRETDFQFTLPTDATLDHVAAVIKEQDGQETPIPVRPDTTQRVTVPAYLTGSEVLQIDVTVKVGAINPGDTFNLHGVALQPGSRIPYILFSQDVSVAPSSTQRVYIPLVIR